MVKRTHCLLMTSHVYSSCQVSSMPKRMVLILSAGAAMLQAQTMVEYGAAAGRSGAATPAAGAAKSAARIFDKVNSSLAGGVKADQASKPRQSTLALTTAAPAPQSPPA